jgi:hypothetical protein
MAKWIGGYCVVCGVSTMARFSDRDPEYCEGCKRRKPQPARLVRGMTPRQRAREREREAAARRALFGPAWAMRAAADAVDRAIGFKRPQLPPPTVPSGTFDYIGPPHTRWTRRQYPHAKVEHYAHRGPV